jgi:hypothetical protein
MKHASTRIVYEFWNKVRGDRLAPARVEIDPSNMRHALSDTFLLAADFVDQLRFRLAGTRVCALFGREIKGEAFAELWGETSRKMIEEQLVILTHEASGLVSARTEDGAQTNLELLLLPLAQVGHTRVRAIGVLAPLGPPFWLGARRVVELELGALRHLGIDTENQPAPRLLPDIEGIRLKHGFVVYSGSRENASGERTG